ncbi:MAG: hypothetical protein P4L41_06900, partial [Flavipsychrobacter sp.]|nr:hypothetical protein [Flavipsychrobacter sp.]
YSKLNLAGSVATTDISPTGATSGQVLGYNGTSVAWTTPSSGSSLSAGTTAGQVYLTGAAGVAPTTPVTVSGDATLASTGALTLGTSGVAAGSYGIPGSPAPLFTVDGKGRITSAQNTTLNLTSAQFANQGTATTVLHGNAAGVPSFGQITNSDVSNTAAIAYSKLNLASSVATTDISSTGATSGQVLGYNGTNVVWTTPSSGGGLSAGTAAGQVYLTGTAGAVPTTPVTVSGDISITSTGVTSYNNVVPTNKGGAGAINGLLSANGAGTVSAASTTGSGSVVLAASPTLVTPSLGTPSALVGTNISGTASNLTAGKATVLATARTINGISFDGSANITVPAGVGYIYTSQGSSTTVAVSTAYLVTTDGITLTLPGTSLVAGNTIKVLVPHSFTSVAINFGSKGGFGAVSFNTYAANSVKVIGTDIEYAQTFVYDGTTWLQISQF